MSTSLPGRKPLPFRRYTPVAFWVVMALANAYTVYREVTYVQVSNGIGWTLAPALIGTGSLAEAAFLVYRLRHPKPTAS